ncbi:MAG TPA: hypothetical protein DCL76_00090 [Chloroflexi bacterium]|nr:hypothetical protein [Chloroflexota bacterium]
MSISRGSIKYIYLFSFLLMFFSFGFVTAEGSGRPFYRVREGDTLYSISAKFGGTIDTIQQLNNISDPSLLSVGQLLELPGYEGFSGFLNVHSVMPGQSLESLSFILDNSFDTLVKLNKVVNPSLLYVGQPIVYINDDETVNKVPGKLLLLESGKTLLELALHSGLNPYEILIANGMTHSDVFVYGQLVYVPTSGNIKQIPEPFLDVNLSSVNPEQGHPIRISVDADPSFSFSGTFGDQILNFVNYDDIFVALVGIHAKTQPGLYPFTILAQKNDNEQIGLDFLIPVSDAGYQSQSIFLTSDKAKLLENVDTRVIEDQVILNKVSSFSDQKLWSGVFDVPISTDYMTTIFGLRRLYNGTNFNTFHGGTDFGAQEGTPIYAPANGIVVMSEELDIRGVTTIIDHGIGVFSGYWHQKELNVEVGQEVVRGEVIGYVGNTGLSTGPHLHWEIWINGVQVDPIEWLKS